MKRFSLIVLILYLSVILGCSKSLPDGFPAIHDCLITLSQEGKPLVKADVLLFSKDGNCPWSVGGTTNQSGTAKILTHGQFSGAPLGNFLITVSKTEAEPYEQGEVRTKPIQIYTFVDKKFSEKSTTPLEISIQKGKNNQTFDLGPVTRTLFETISPNGP